MACWRIPSRPRKSAWSPGFWACFLGCGLVLAVVIPVLNLWMPPNSAAALPDYLVPLLGKYLCYALLALSLDLIWGYAGILSLGHGAFFALGGYCMGMYLMRQIGTRGVYGNPLLPDFMVFLNWQELPWFWWGFDHFAWAAAMVMLVPGLLALVFGWLAFRSRVTGVYLSIITQAMTYALMLAFFRNDMGFGGNNGMTDYKDILGWDVHQPATRLGLYLASVAGPRARLSAVPLHHHLQARSRPVGAARRRKPGALSRLFGDQRQAVRLHGLGGARRHRRRALRAAGRHHQPERILAGQLDRDRDLGLGRRPRHVDRERSSARSSSTWRKPG